MARHPPDQSRHLSRRSVLLTGTGLTAGFMLGAMPFPAPGQGTTASAAGFEDFMRLSARLTGREQLLAAQGRVAFEALSARFPGFGEGLAQLIRFMEEHDGPVTGLQAALDESGAEFDGLFCATDTLAIGALRGLADRGVRVPHDVKVLGYDDIAEGEFLVPSLSSIAPDHDGMARTAIDLLRRRIEDRSSQQREELVSSFRLVERESTASR